MSSYKELLSKREALDKQISDLREKEVKTALEMIHGLIQEFGLTQEDVFAQAKRASTAGSKVEPKYRDPTSGATWTGRGKPPRWIADQDREKFLIA
jgi:DNA-binding protein H-NS